MNRSQVMYLHTKAKIQDLCRQQMLNNPSSADSTIQFLKSIDGAKLYCLYHQVDSDLHSDKQRGRTKCNNLTEVANDYNLGYFFQYENSDGKIIVDHVEFTEELQHDLDHFGSIHRNSDLFGSIIRKKC